MTQHVHTWKKVQLGDYVDLLTGHPFKSKIFSEDEKDTRLLRGDNVAQGFLRWSNAKRWSREEYETHQRYHLNNGDVILAMDRPWIPAGLKYAWVKDDDLPCLLVQRVARLRGINGLLTDYLRYIVGSLDFTNHVLSITTGVNIPHISGRDIKAFTFNLPPEPIQERIVSVLQPYDDLIENNTRRIEILEEMARRLYEEWFVHFRFPGHEGVKFKESELGRIPDDWNVLSLGDVSELTWGDTKTTKKAYSEEGYVAYSAAGPDGLLPYFDHNRSGIVLSAIGANCGFTWLALGKWSCIKNTIKFWPTRNDISCEYLYLATQGNEFWPKRGAAQPFISQGDARNCKILIPPAALHCKFQSLAERSFQLADVLHRKNINLRAQRDLLLPKLISGEIDVSNIPMPDDKEVEAA